jgi:hypothetical protein
VASGVAGCWERGVRRGGEPVGRAVAALTACEAPAVGPMGCALRDKTGFEAFCDLRRRVRG